MYGSGLLRRLANGRHCGAILMFHEIAPASGERLHGFLSRISRQFTIVSLEELLGELASLHPPKSLPIALTFDDGLKNHSTVVYPILRDLNLSATFYVCPGLIESVPATWTWEMVCRIAWLSEPDLQTIFGQRGTGYGTAELLHWMQRIPVNERMSIVENVRKHTKEFEFTESELDLYGLMSWGDLRALDPAIVNVGSHTMTHPDLPQLSAAELESELETSKLFLEQELGRPVRDLAYPNGNFDQAVVDFSARCYRSAVTTNCGGVRALDSPFTLNRISADEIDLKWTSWLLAMHTGKGHRC